ncbi:hypothetical protein [Phormidium tenue]|uniref:hypothetical protein n=1 Tax=Phormidium tenue TaxID=126344 RepID=UPI0011150A01|nr:hypothetical protein [Phormidium tenue]MBD2230966.1 hypothetical protein [Phormidium tenue FACHB-1052]
MQRLHAKPLTQGLISIQKLKAEVFRVWCWIHRSNMAQVQPENFEPEVRRLFGDLRLKHTWEKAYSHFFVSWVFDCICDGDTYFQVLDPKDWYDWEYELRLLTFQALAAHPRSESMTRNSYSYIARYERASLADGFFALAKEAVERQQQYSTSSTVVIPQTDPQPDQAAQSLHRVSACCSTV